MGCPAAAQSQAAIEQLLGKPLAEIAVDLSAHVQIRQNSPTDFEARITLAAQGPASERILRDSQCGVLADAAAVVVALALDSMTSITAASERASASATPDPAAAPSKRAANRPKSAPSIAPEPRASAASAAGPTAAAPAMSTMAEPAAARARRGPARDSARADAAPTREGAAARRERDLQGYVAGAAALAVGTLPGVAPGLALASGLSESRWRLGLRLSYLPAQLATLAMPAGVGGRIALFAAAFEGGLRLRFRALEFPLLAGLESGFLRAQGRRVAEPRAQRPTWLGTYLGSGLRFVWNARFAIGVRCDALLALRRPSFAARSNLGEKRVFHRPERYAARGYLELELRFP